MSHYTPKDIARFWKYIDKSKGESECWEWVGAKLRTGYGTLGVQGKTRLTHRMMWELTNGPIPEGIFICHHCDNPRCCNPKHLFAGTQLENIRDMIRKGRESTHFGETSVSAKLTTKQVIEIRETYAQGEITQKELAKKYGIVGSTVSRIVTGKKRKKG